MLKALGLTAGVMGIAVTWDNLINLFFQPWAGSRSDRTHTLFVKEPPVPAVPAGEKEPGLWQNIQLDLRLDVRPTR
jgi:hypothetical protein